MGAAPEDCSRQVCHGTRGETTGKSALAVEALRGGGS